MPPVVYLVVLCLSSVLQQGQAEENRTLAQCSFDDTVNCGFQYKLDEGAHHLELWTISRGNSRGANSPPADHTPGSGSDVFANSKSLESTAPADFGNFSTSLISPLMNVTSGLGHISFYYFLWISSDPEGNKETLPTLRVIGCDLELVWTKTAVTAGWQYAEMDFPCSTPGKIVFEAFHRRPGSGVAIDDVTITEHPSLSKGISPSDPLPTLGMEPADPVNVSPGFPRPPGVSTTVAVALHSGFGGRMMVIAIGCFLGVVLVVAISIVIHCFFWRRRKRTNSNLMMGSNGGMHVPNRGYDFLTGIAGTHSGTSGSRTLGSETTTMSTISKGLGGSSYQMDVISDETAKQPATGIFEKRVEGYPAPPKGKRRSLTLASFKRSRSGRDRSFEYSEIPDTASPTEDVSNVYHFMTTPRKDNGVAKTPKLGAIGRSAAQMQRSNSLPSRNSVESTASNKQEGPYHITDLIGNVSVDNLLFPSMETLGGEDITGKRKESVKYDLPQFVPSNNQQSREDEHFYKGLELNNSSSHDYDALRHKTTPPMKRGMDQSSGQCQDEDGYDPLEPTPISNKAPRDLSDYEKPPPPPISPKPISPFAPRPMSPRQNSQLPSVVQSNTVPQTIEDGPDGFVLLRDPPYFTLVPDLVRDASYEYPAIVVHEDLGIGVGDVPGGTSDSESNPYESFELPPTPTDKKKAPVASKPRQNFKMASIDEGETHASIKQNTKAMTKEEQLAKFLDDDYENVV